MMDLEHLETLLARLPRELDPGDLDALPTLHYGQFGNLKIDTGALRIWKSRCDIRSGEREPAHVEFLVDGCWVDIKNHPDYEDRFIDQSVLRSAVVTILPGTDFRYYLRNEQPIK